ncbi:uncharacterized protein LOC131014713 [Salvia miltiorrhiza]|uniref:uncharacterized protein LOC131014713 n=1 Tax=Salvia miltiorrhiza TaxID=226208 RepID=UPI0025AC73FC|nr:uncharacterized protein LOC131014713 [Salvia miltiorrhiza]
MASLSEYEEEDRNKASSSVAKPFSSFLDPSDPLGFLEKVFEFVARESNLFKSDSLVRDVNAVVRMVNDKVEAEERKRNEEEKKAAERKAALAPVKKEVVAADKEAESQPDEAAKGPRAPSKLNGPEPPKMMTRAGYTTAETELICTLWAEATLNSRKSADQKAIPYWGDIKKRYNVIRPTGTMTREVKQIKSHFQRVHKDVKVWEAIYDKCKSNWGRDMSDDDQIVLQAQEIFQTNKNAHFKHLSAWRILRESQRCASIKEEVNSLKRTKNTSEGGYTRSCSEPSITARPTSQKAAKKNNKGKEKSSELSSSPPNWESIFADHLGSLKQVNRDTVDHQILITDTSRMGAVELARHNRMVNEIVKRRGWDH